MRLWLLSDIHSEVAAWSPPAIPEADICIAAGDIGRGVAGHVQWLLDHVEPWMPSLSVLGNHEFYKSSYERERSRAQGVRGGRVQILDDSVVLVDNVRFVGGTLWSDFDLYSGGEERWRDHAMAVAALGMNDHRMIKRWHGGGAPLTPAQTRAAHQASVAYIESVLAAPFDGETVVVTHHAPSPRSIAADFQNDPLTPAYASDLEWLIEKYQPALWVHGHMHDSFDYEIGATRVIANPKGYGMENAKSFDPGMIVEIGGCSPRPRI